MSKNIITRYKQFSNELLESVTLPANVMYHGTSMGVRGYTLMPRPSNVLNGESAVFATPDKWLALVFIPRWSDDDFELSVEDGVGVLTEQRPNAIEVLNSPGYLYTVDAEQFGSDPRLGMQGSEFICKQPVAILKLQNISSVLDEMVQLPGRIVKYKEAIKRQSMGTAELEQEDAE